MSRRRCGDEDSFQEQSCCMRAPLHSYSFIFFNATCLNGENTDILIGGLLFWCACPQESGRAVADGDRQGWTLAVLRQCVPGMYNYPCVPSVCLCG